METNLTPLKTKQDMREVWKNFPNNPISFVEAKEIVRSAHEKDGEADDIYSSALNSWAFGTTDGEHMSIARIPYPGRETGDPLILRNNAFNQLCSRTKVGKTDMKTPPDYIRALPQKLQVACMNFGLLHNSSNTTFRLAGNEVRSIMSERYAPIDDLTLIDEVGEYLDRTSLIDKVSVRSVATGPHMIMRVTVPTESVEVKLNDSIEWGFDIGNSELGLRSVQITPITYRLVCLNGMRSWKSEATKKFRHIGDPRKLQDGIRDAIPVAMAEANGDIKKWENSVSVLIDNALDEIESLSGFGLGKGEIKKVQNQLVKDTLQHDQAILDNTTRKLFDEKSVTAYDIANAVTATGRDLSTVSRLNFEEVGHRYLSKVAA